MSDYERAVRALERGIDRFVPRQVLDETSPKDGGCISSSWGIASPTSGDTCEMIRQFGLAYLTPESQYYTESWLLDRIERAVAFQRRCQRPSGRIDLPTCNFDSAPDTAFGVSKLADLAWYARSRSDTKGGKTVETALEPYLKSAAEGIADGGFHTPNHRWVIAGALAQVHELYPDESLVDTVESYLAEGIDINEDGEYTERSHAIYSNVVNKHLIRASRSLDRPSLFDPVRRNLHTLVDFMNHDWTVDTSVSRRQDYGERTVPVRGAPNFYCVARRDADDRLATAAHGLLENGGWDDPGVAADLLSHFARNPSWRETDLPTGRRADAASRQMELSGVCRFRDGEFSVTVAKETSEVVSLSYGSSAMLELCVVSPYFGTGFFTGRDIAFADESVTVTLRRSFHDPDLPCYWKPLDRPVGWGDMESDEREVVPMPEFEPELTVGRVPDGIELGLRTHGGISQVPFAVEARFPGDGWLELERSTVPATSERPVFLGDETATYHRDGDAITLGPGFHGHRLSDSPDDPGSALRVLLTDWTPVDRHFVVTAGEWTGADLADRTSGGPSSVSGPTG